MPLPRRFGVAVGRILTPGLPPNRFLRAALAAIAFVLAVRGSLLITSDGLLGVDLEIPLRAAERFVTGGQPYQASSFFVTSGPGLPYLYPPYLLPLLALLLAIPLTLLIVAWFCLCLAVAAATCRRLAIPFLAIPLVLIWPAFWEALWHGNVEILIFAAFVALLFEPARGAAYQPIDRRIRSGPGSTLRDGLLAAAMAVVKPSEGWAWIYVLRRHPRAAIGGVVMVIVLVLGTLPLTGAASWLGYAAQAARAADPHWIAFGGGPAHFISGWPTAAITVASLLLAAIVPPKSAGAWLGILTVIGAPTLRGYDLIFLLPALLRIRREIALVVVIVDATLAIPAIWLAITITAVVMLLGLRFPLLLEPSQASPGGAAASPVPA